MARNKAIAFPSCLTFSAESMYDSSAKHLLEFFNLTYTEEQLRYIGLKSRFSWTNYQRPAWNQIVRGVVYTRISFYEKEAVKDVVELSPSGKTISPRILQQLSPSIESKFEIMIFTNSWEYQADFLGK